MAAGSSEPAADGILVASVGLAYMRDLSFGIKVMERLRATPLRRDAEVADLSFGTIAAVQRLSERRYRRAIFVSGTARGRAPGTLHRFTPPAELPQLEEIHARVGDGVMGSVSVDNLVIIGRYYGHLPPDVVLVEAEPADEGWGAELSPAVAAVLDDAVSIVQAEVERP